MSDSEPKPNNLVLYKNAPARVTAIVGKKIEIITQEGISLTVRPKDVTILHPGPIESLEDLHPVEGDIETAWELLAGHNTTLSAFVELAYGEHTPAAVWSGWQIVLDGLYMSGTPQDLQIYTPEQVEVIKTERSQKAAAQQAWEAFLFRLSKGYYIDDDKPYLLEIASLANGERKFSRIQKALGRVETPENAHALLLQIGFWDDTNNPYPARAKLAYHAPDVFLRPLPDEQRRDLTHLISLAIDDEASQDPDDAISLEYGRLWVHIADVAALVPPNSEADLVAQARGANLYLPEGTVTMLPRDATANLALGLQEISPALSFGLNLESEDDLPHLEIVPSWIRVTRLSYEEAEQRLSEPLLRELHSIAIANIKRRLARGAIEINLPEVKVRVDADEIQIKAITPTISRDIVREAMLLTGEAVAHFCVEHQIPIPFTGQESPAEIPLQAQSLSEMFDLRRIMKPSQQGSKPTQHAGLGLPIYVQATSPLRRYLDLVVHQQLRSFLAGERLLDEQDLMKRVGSADAVGGDVRWAERRSNEHWKLVYLKRHPEWQGEGIIVDKRGRRDIILIPELDLETQMYLHRDLPLDSQIRLAVLSVNLPELTATFRPIDLGS